MSRQPQISIATDAAGNLLVGSDGNFALSVSHVAPTVGAVNDGTDTLYNIERLQFSDVTFDTGAFTLAPIFNSAAQGALTIDNPTPAVGDVLSVTSTINDFEGVVVAEAIRLLRRRISDAVFAALRADPN